MELKMGPTLALLLTNLYKGKKAQFRRSNLLTFIPPFLNLCGKRHQVKER